MATFPKLKLTYFNGAGRAEATRLAFHIGGVPFVDDRIDGPEFGRRKPTFVYGQVPVLEVDGVEMAQSQAILRYAGKLAGLYPVNDPIAALQVDEILGALDELLDKIVPSMREQDADKKKAMRVELSTVTIPRHLKLLNARLVEMKKSAVFADDKIFIHELAIYSQYLQLKSGRLDDIPTDIADGYAEFMAAANKVLSHPKVQQWNALHASTEAPKIKLTYFDGPGRAEPIRLAFAIGDIAFEDERIERSELAARRESLPYGQVPVLEVNGKVMAQSLAILRYAGTLAGLYPSNDPLVAFRIDELLSLTDDIYASVLPVMFAPEGEGKVAAAKELVEVTLPRILGNMEKRIEQWGGPYAVGDKLSIADLIVYSMIVGMKNYAMRGLPPVTLDAFPTLTRLYAQVLEHEKVKAWYAKTAA